MRKVFLCIGLLYLLAGCTTSRQKPLDAVIDEALAAAERQSLLMAEKYRDQEGRLPRTWGDGEDVSSDSRWWTSGFFPGTLWYLYENSRNPEVLEYAKLFTSRVEREKFTTDNHDVGFMLGCSFLNGLRLTGEKEYEEVLQTGAASLSTRYNPQVGLIRSWDHNRDKWQYPVIIDNMMNLELLLWAAEHSGNERYREISVSHADKTMMHHFRPDFSSYHLVSYDTLTGEPHLKQTWQGSGDESSWSRGQAWGLYGFTSMYRHTKDERYLEQAKNIANYIINHPRLPEDGIPYWDFDAPGIPDTPRDASAAAIIASALIELSGFVDPECVKEYMRVAEIQIRTLSSEAYTAPCGENGNFILMHGTGAYPFGSEIDAPLAFADYYYIEALTRLKQRL